MDFEVFPVPESLAKTAHIDATRYAALYRQSLENPDAFWAERARRLDWVRFPTRIDESSFTPPIHVSWYADGVLNACYNCVDRHLPARAAQSALIWESDTPGVSETITYARLKDEVCRLSGALHERGVRRGDRVTIYMPMIPQAVYAMLACARIGAIHSVVFGGFSAEALQSRILDCKSTFVITADEGVRGGKSIPLKTNVDKALTGCPDVSTVLVFPRTGAGVPMTPGRDVVWHEIVDRQSPEFPCADMGAEDPLFILYTSGSTGKPKGVLHTTGGYLVFSALTHEWVFDYHDGEVYWCTADVGWVTGHSYIVYGPLANGATSLIFEGVPNYPDWSRFWQIVDRHKVNIFYTAPTALRAMLQAGDGWVSKTSRASLRILGTVGEPINHEAWLWYHHIVGEGRCPIIDTWWQTETGGHMLTPLPGATPLKPGSATKPFFGVEPVLVDAAGTVLTGPAEGNLCFARSWPGMMRTVYGDPDRFAQTYFSTFPGLYFSGDGARRDEDGDYWITGRVDDVINVSGHRLGTAEIESAVDACPHVAEAAVVGYPHDIKGQGIYVYVILHAGIRPDESIRQDILRTVRTVIGPIATPDVIQFVPGLPKTRSGKIMRRILRKIAAGDTGSLGDTSTLADPGIVAELVAGRPDNA